MPIIHSVQLGGNSNVASKTIICSPEAFLCGLLIFLGMVLGNIFNVALKDGPVHSSFIPEIILNLS